MCEFCSNDKDIIFPFQLNKCQRCEGEHSSRAPSSRTSFPLTWRDWKIPNPRRLARLLSRGRREGEGGEKALQLEIAQEELEDTAEVRLDSGGIFQAFTSGKLVKAFPRSTCGGEEEELTRSAESETDEELESDEGKKGDDQNVEMHHKGWDKDKMSGDEHESREKVNLLKVLHIDRFKKSMSKQDRRGSDNETCSSLESLEEVGQERKGRWRVSGLASRIGGFLKRESEDEKETKLKEEGGNEEFKERSLEKEETDEEGKALTEFEAATINTERSPGLKLLKPRQLRSVFSKGRSKRGDDGGGEESGGNKDVRTQEEDCEGPKVKVQVNWRGRKTRKARRVTSGRRMRERDEEDESRGEGTETHDQDNYTAGAVGQE